MRPYTGYDDPAEIILARRNELSLNQRELAARLDLDSTNFITMMEKGKSRVPLERSVDIARALEMSDRNWFIKKVLKQRYPAVFDSLFAGD